MNKVFRVIFRQHNIGAWVGGFKSILGGVTFYIAIINFVLIAITAYHTTLSPTIIRFLPWFNLPLFLGVMVVLLLALMVIEFKFVMPSLITFANLQVYTHRNLLKRDLEKIMKKLDALEKKVG